MQTDGELVDLIDRTMFRRGIDAAGMSRLAGEHGLTLDAGTVGDMLARKRTPRRSTLGKMIRILDIDIDGAAEIPQTTQFEEVVLADPTLIEEAKDHLIRQYELLQRASAATPTNVARMPIERAQAANRGDSVGKRKRAAQDADAEAPDVS